MPEIEIPQPEEMHEKAENPFTKRVALFVAIYAVILALAAAGGNNAGKDMLMNQMKATNTWSRYQAKVQREVMYTQEKENLESDLASAGIAADIKERKSKRLATITAKLAEYEKDKKEITEEAKKLEHDRDDSHARDPYFDMAEVLMQISIVLSSVAMLSGKKWAFWLSLGLAVVGLFLTLNGFFLFDGGKLFGAHGPAAAAH